MGISWFHLLLALSSLAYSASRIGGFCPSFIFLRFQCKGVSGFKVYSSRTSSSGLSWTVSCSISICGSEVILASLSWFHFLASFSLFVVLRSSFYFQCIFLVFLFFCLLCSSFLFLLSCSLCPWFIIRWVFFVGSFLLCSLGFS